MIIEGAREIVQVEKKSGGIEGNKQERIVQNGIKLQLQHLGGAQDLIKEIKIRSRWVLQYSVDS